MTEQFDVAAADRSHVWHPYTQHGSGGAPLPIVRAEGAYIYDGRGRRVFDAISSWWVTLHAHAHPVIVEAIARQAAKLEQVIFADFTHEGAARLAVALCERAPAGLERVFFSDDGSTAVEVALKLAVQYWRNRGEDRRAIVALDGAYHGDTFGAMSVSERGVFTAAFTPLLFDVIRLGNPSKNDVALELTDLIERRGREIAAVIVEPRLQGAGGMRIWGDDQLRALRMTSERAGIPLVADEVLTGFGRTGPMFACAAAGVSPDMMCLSKGLTGGFLPMGATLVTSQVFDAFLSDDRSRMFFHGHSFTANPLACAAALASLSLLDDDCARRRQAIERTHRTAAERLRSFDSVHDVRVLGTLLAFELAGSAGYPNTQGLALRQFALDRQVLLRPLGNTVYVLPPYCSTSEDLGHVYDVIEQFLARG